MWPVAFEQSHRAVRTQCALRLAQLLHFRYYSPRHSVSFRLAISLVLAHSELLWLASIYVSVHVWCWRTYRRDDWRLVFSLCLERACRVAVEDRSAEQPGTPGAFANQRRVAPAPSDSPYKNRAYVGCRCARSHCGDAGNSAETTCQSCTSKTTKIVAAHALLTRATALFHWKFRLNSLRSTRHNTCSRSNVTTWSTSARMPIHSPNLWSWWLGT